MATVASSSVCKQQGRLCNSLGSRANVRLYRGLRRYGDFDYGAQVAQPVHFRPRDHERVIGQVEKLEADQGGERVLIDVAQSIAAQVEPGQTVRVK